MARGGLARASAAFVRCFVRSCCGRCRSSVRCLHLRGRTWSSLRSDPRGLNLRCRTRYLCGALLRLYHALLLLHTTLLLNIGRCC